MLPIAAELLPCPMVDVIIARDFSTRIRGAYFGRTLQIVLLRLWSFNVKGNELSFALSGSKVIR